MARLVGPSDPTGNGKDTIRKWEDGDGPSGPVATMVNLICDGLGQHYSDEVEVFFKDYVRRRITVL